MGVKVGGLISRPPEHSGFTRVIDRLRQEHAIGRRLYLYCIDDGILAIRHPELQRLRDRGASLFACAYAAQKRGLPIDDSAIFAGLGMLADIILATDVFDTDNGGPWTSDPGTKNVAIHTAADPFASHRTAEAVRVAAGLQQSGSLDVTLTLEGTATRCLDADAGEAVDGAHFLQYLPLFRESRGRILTEPAAEPPAPAIVIRF